MQQEQYKNDEVKDGKNNQQEQQKDFEAEVTDNKQDTNKNKEVKKNKKNIRSSKRLKERNADIIESESESSCDERLDFNPRTLLDLAGEDRG